MLDRLFNMTEKKERQRLQGTRSAARPRPQPRPQEPVFQVFDRDSRTWTPQEVPAAVPCPLTVLCEGKPLMGIAVVDARMAFDLPMELVPPKEAVSGGPLILEKGGCFLFSDDYVQRHPESKVAALVREFSVKKTSELEKLRVEQGLVEVAEVAELPEDADHSTSTAGPTPSVSAASSTTSAPKSKTQKVREFLQEAEKVDRPLFRRQDPTAFYGQAKYGKRNFHAIMDDEYPIEYFI